MTKQMPLMDYLITILKQPTYSELISEDSFKTMAHALVENGVTLGDKPEQILKGIRRRSKYAWMHTPPLYKRVKTKWFAKHKKKYGAKTDE